MLRIRIDGVENDWLIGQELVFDYHKTYEILVEGQWRGLYEYLDEVEEGPQI